MNKISVITDSHQRIQELRSSEPIVARMRVGRPGRPQWIVFPRDFPALVKHINQHGGPSVWDLAPPTLSSSH